MSKTSNSKSLLNSSELALYRDSLPKVISKLSLLELEDRQRRVRELRDKWEGQLRTQTRAVQNRNASREVAGNRRTEDKVKLFNQALAAFTDRIDAVRSDAVAAPTASRLKPAHRKDRRIENKADRSKMRQGLGQQKVAINRTATSKRSSTAKPSSMVTTTLQPASRSLAAAKEPITKPKPATSPTKKKKTSSRKTKGKAPVPSKTKALKAPVAVKDTSLRLPSQPAILKSIRSVSPNPALTSLARTQLNAKNQRLSALSTKSRIARSGTTNIRAHGAAANRRSQKRRDSGR